MHPSSCSARTVRVRCPLCPASDTRTYGVGRGLSIHTSRIHTAIAAPAPPAAGAPAVAVSTRSIVLVSPSSQNIIAPDSQSASNFVKEIQHLRCNVPILKRIPRAARDQAARKLTEVITECSNKNTQASWEELFKFAYKVLHVTNNDNTPLPAKIKRNIREYEKRDPLAHPVHLRSSTNESSMIKRVEGKVFDGDVKGAVRLLTSEDTLAVEDTDTLAALHSKHPIPLHPVVIQDNDSSGCTQIQCDKMDIIEALASFPNGSAAGMDGISPSHLKDLTNGANGQAGQSLLEALTNLCNFMLQGKVVSVFTPFVYGASLCALKKKEGGIRPIAVGSTIRRICSKIVCKRVNIKLQSVFQPIQLGFATKGGCEVAVHAARTYLNTKRDPHVLVKLDVSNAFNSIERDPMLGAVREHIPEAYSYLAQCYSKTSNLFYRNNIIDSSVGCQQGDPLGPPIFSLGILEPVKQIKSDLNLWYLDDGILSGDIDIVLADLITLIENFDKIGLKLNFAKCQIYFSDNFSAEERSSAMSSFNAVIPGFQSLSRDNLFVLGAPLTDESISPLVVQKQNKLHLFVDRLKLLNRHVAFFLLRHCFSIPRLTYFLRCSPMWKHEESMRAMDDAIKSSLHLLLNINMEPASWRQANLPIKYGGIGIRSVEDVALPAFLSSCHAGLDLIGKILRPSLSEFEVSHMSDALECWKVRCPQTDLPTSVCLQKAWDLPAVKIHQREILSLSTGVDRARLLASAERETGVWLNAYPSPHLGTLMDNNSIRVAVALRVGAKVCQPHSCVCGASVDPYGHHGLSCQRSAGRWSRHSSINLLIKRALATVNIPSLLEPPGLSRDDGKKADGMTLVPWSRGKALVWDATCADTFAPSHLTSSSRSAGSAAISAENFKKGKYLHLAANFEFLAFAVETLGVWSPDAKSFGKELGKLLVDKSSDRRASAFFAQRVALAIQRGNCASVLGTAGESAVLEEVYLLT